MTLHSAFFYLISVLSILHTTLADYNPADAIDYFTATLISTSPADAIIAWNCVRCPELIGYHPYHSQALTAPTGEDFPMTMLYNPDVKKFVIAFPGTSTLQQLLRQQANLNPVPYE